MLNWFKRHLFSKVLIEKDVMDYYTRTLGKYEKRITELELEMNKPKEINNLTSVQDVIDFYNETVTAYETRIAELEKQLESKTELDERMEDWLCLTLPVYNSFHDHLDNLYEMTQAQLYEEQGCQQEHEL